MPKLVLAVDLDDVIGSLVPAVAHFFNQAYPDPHKHYQLSTFTSYDWTKVLGLSVEEVQLRMQKFFDSEFFNQLPLVSGVISALTKLNTKYEIHIVTSRQTFLEKATKEWVNLNCPNLIAAIHFGNMYGIGPSRKKVDICKEINAVAIIDDIPSTCISCASGGVFSILFNLDGSYLWSNLEQNEIPANMQVANSWEQVVTILMDS